jgi:zinc transport system permease protein
MFEILQYQFMQNAIIAAVLVSVACGLVGTYVVLKRIVSISGGISHAAFGGIGLGYFLGINPIITAIPFSILSAVFMGEISKKVNISEDTAIGILWSLGMAIGIIFINLTPGYAPDLFSYLFGSILTVPTSDLLIMFLLDIIILLMVILFRREFAAISFDEEFAQAAGMRSDLFYMILLALVALSVVVLIKVVGIILIIALLTIPSAIARQFTYNLPRLMMLSIFTGIFLTMSGLWLSYIFDISSGATIVLMLGMAFFVFTGIKKYIEKKK